MRAAALALLVAGCATAPNVVTFDRCATGRVIDACSVADYPPLVELLPRWPFPSLMQPIPEPPPPETPASRIMDRLIK